MDAGPRRRAFRARFRRVQDVVAEIPKVAGHAPALAAEGGVPFLERLAPPLERVDSSSGPIGTAANRAIGALVPIIAGAPADAAMRGVWLDRRWPRTRCRTSNCSPNIGANCAA